MKLCDLLSMTVARVNLIERVNETPTVICQIRNALMASVYLPYEVFHGEVVSIEPSKEFNCLDVAITFANKERDELEECVDISEDDYYE